MTDEGIVPPLPVIGCDNDPNPIDWLECCLARIEDSNGAIRAVVALDRKGSSDAAVGSAARWRTGFPRSSIDGVPFLVKANIAVAGLPWHAGIAALRDRTAVEDAPAVARLRAAGAVIMGLTNMDEGALGATGDNSWLGRIGNPRDAALSPGGSSGGSAAAVAAGYCMAALGSDTIGSVAIPAAYCGVVGHRARRAVLPLAGVVPLSATFDHLGWLARTTADAWAIGRSLGIRAPEPRQIRIAALAVDGLDLPKTIAALMDNGIDSARQAGYGLGKLDSHIVLQDVARRLFEVAEADAAVALRQTLIDRPNDFSPGFRRMLEWGATNGALRRDENATALSDIAKSIRRDLSGFDALLMPAVPRPAPAAGSSSSGDQALFAAVPACLGWPATTVPAGSDGLALLVTASSDDLCLSIAQRIAAKLG